MAQLIVGKSLSDDDVLWRYMPLEGFINMLDSNSLYFSPLHAYRQSDPFEGFMPKIAMDALASVTGNSYKRIIAEIDAIEKQLGNDKGQHEIAKMRQSAARFPIEMREVYKKIVDCLVVNCWHKSPHESEAMWGLYSNSGVAIRTTVRSIKAALEGNLQNYKIHMGAIRYLDFADKALVPADCVSQDGHMMGMIKRIAFAHEQEVRLFITRDVPPHQMDGVQPEPISLDIDAMRLMDEIIISPVASISMRKCIYAVAKRYSVSLNKIRYSPLRDNCEYLLDSYNSQAQ